MIPHMVPPERVVPTRALEVLNAALGKAKGAAEHARSRRMRRRRRRQCRRSRGSRGFSSCTAWAASCESGWSWSMASSVPKHAALKVPPVFHKPPRTNIPHARAHTVNITLVSAYRYVSGTAQNLGWELDPLTAARSAAYSCCRASCTCARPTNTGPARTKAPRTPGAELPRCIAAPSLRHSSFVVPAAATSEHDRQ